MNIYSNKILTMEEQHKKDLISCLEIISETLEKALPLLKIEGKIKKETENRMDIDIFSEDIKKVICSYILLTKQEEVIFYNINDFCGVDFFINNQSKIDHFMFMTNEKTTKEIIQFLKDGKRQVNDNILNKKTLNDLEVRELSDSLGFSCVYESQYYSLYVMKVIKENKEQVMKIIS